MKLLFCAIYLWAIGILFLFVGLSLPRVWFDSEKFPFTVYSWERKGTVYERFHIRKWKDKLPDMSKIIPGMVPKQLHGEWIGKNFERLIRETCVAEAVHIALIIAGLGCYLIWPGAGGILVAVIWAIGNMPFILIQRYNRPRLKRIAGQVNSVKRESNHIGKELGQ